MRMRSTNRLWLGAWVGAISLAASLWIGCAGFSASRPSESDADALARPMSQARMELLFANHVEAIMGPPGAIQTRVDGVSVYLISDPLRDRMRLVAPVARMNQANRGLALVLLRANFFSTLDARYAVSDGLVYAAFLHPLSSLTPELLESALAQVLSLAKTFGSSFSSGLLQFGAPRADDE